MTSKPVAAYLLASLCLGAITFFASENLFWSAPLPDMRPWEWVLTILAYSICSAAVLSCLLWAGLGGWRAAFLGGAVLGWLIEGVVVGTAYEGFPLQLIWTPLAWHALVTGLGVIGICRYGVHWPVWRQVVGLMALGLLTGTFALYWPLERGAMPGPVPVFAYMVIFGLLVPLGNLGLDRVGRLARPPLWLLWAAPSLLGVIWLAQSIAVPSPQRLSVPLLIALTLWAMRRLAGQPAAGLDFGPPAPYWRHLLFLIAPLVSVVVSLPGWAATDGMESNIPVALATGLTSLALLLWLYARAIRSRTPA